MGTKLKKVDRVVMVCGGSECKSAGSKKLLKKAEAHAKDLGIAGSTHFVMTECNDFCKDAPVVSLQPGNVWIPRATGKAIRKALSSAKSRPE